MRGSRLCAKAVAFLLVSVVPAFAVTPQPVADLRAAPMPPSFIALMPPLFDTQDIFRGDTSPFKQWTDMLGRAKAEFVTAPGACTGPRPECAMIEWSQLVARLTPLPLREKVIRAQVILNGVPYVPTARNWSRTAYWETPLEFLVYGGQCQDYAIAKYMLLRQAGVPADQMRIVVLRATALGEDHAVLVVNVDGETLMLDDERTGVMPASSVMSYRPYYSINELGWWQHIAPQEIAPSTIETADRQAGTASQPAVDGSLAASVGFTFGPLRRAAHIIESILIPFAESSS